MEYLGNCPKCKHHTIVRTVKQIPHTEGQRLPQREEKCINCGETKRITIIGEVVKDAETSRTVSPEFATVNRLVFKKWN